MPGSDQTDEKILQLVGEQNSDFVLVYDQQKQLVCCNQPIYDFLGLQKQPRVLPEIPAILQPAFFPAIHAPSEETTDNMHKSYLSINDSTGKSRRLLQTIKSQSLNDGRSCYIVVYRDVTEILELQDSLELQNKKLGKTRDALEALSRVTIEMHESRDLSSVLETIINSTVKVVHADFVFAAMIDESGEYLEDFTSLNVPDDLSSPAIVQGEGVSGKVWQLGKTMAVKDYQNHPLKMEGREFLKQTIVAPIKVNNEVVGILGVAYREICEDFDSHIHIVEKFASMVVIAIEKFALYENSTSEIVRTETVNELNEALHGSKDFKSLLDLLCLKLVQVFNISKTSIYRYDDETGFTPMVAWRESENTIQPAEQPNGAVVAGSIGKWCIENKRTAFIKRGVEDARDSKEVHLYRKEMRLGSTVGIPLIHENKPWGIIFVHRQIEHKDFSKNEINYFNIIGSQASIALHGQELLHRVQYQAHHDKLTNLPNRSKFESILNKVITEDSTRDMELAVLYLDLDGFKPINDTYGHAVGDDLLHQVALRLRSCLAANDTLARMGGDEFSVILTNYSTRRYVEDLAEQIVRSIASEFTCAGISIQIGVSVGINFYPDDAKTVTGLLKNADIAMYNAKSGGKGAVSVFSEQDAQRYNRKLKLEADLKRAISQKQFELHYQPKILTVSGTSNSVEALIRWRHPDFGFIPPLEFISVAEECGLILPLGNWVIEEACRMGVRMIAQGNETAIAVNISAKQLSRSDFADTTLEIIDRTGLPADLLELEITESLVLGEIEPLNRCLNRLRNAGIKIALDDFGTGYSSLKYLEDLPLDILKIDKAFIDKLSEHSSDRSLANTIVLMAKSFNLTTVAEGVETKEQVEIVKQLGCDYMQGYYYSKPVSEEELPKILSKINQFPRLKSAA